MKHALDDKPALNSTRGEPASRAWRSLTVLCQPTFRAGDSGDHQFARSISGELRPDLVLLAGGGAEWLESPDFIDKPASP